MSHSRPQLSDVEKGQIIAYSDSGKSNVWIAKKFRRSEKSIRDLKRKFIAYQTVERAPGSGRPRKLSPRSVRHIVNNVKGDRDITAKQIRDELQLNDVSDDTIRRTIREVLGFKSYFKITKPFVSDINREKRLQWAAEHLNWSSEISLMV